MAADAAQLSGIARRSLRRDASDLRTPGGGKKGATSMSKAESGKIELHPEPYDSAVFRSYLDSVVAPLCREKGIRFVVEVSPVPGVVPMPQSCRPFPILGSPAAQVKW